MKKPLIKRAGDADTIDGTRIQLYEVGRRKRIWTVFINPKKKRKNAA